MRGVCDANSGVMLLEVSCWPFGCQIGLGSGVFVLGCSLKCQASSSPSN